MDYLELDDSAMQALGELDADFDIQHVASNPPIAIPTTVQKHPRRRIEATYLLRLEDPIPTPRHLATVIGLSRVPQLENGTAEDGEASFCRLSQSSINALDSWATRQHLKTKLTKIRLGLAHEDPGPLPMLGRDPTLPHHRPISSASLTEQQALEYPVHYFFYGTLADPERLERLFGIPASELAPLRPATLLDGHVGTWAGKYRALVDKPGAKVNGFAYKVTSTDQGEALRVYEGDNYEVVAAKLIVDGEEMIGRTFRFAGFDDELTE